MVQTCKMLKLFKLFEILTTISFILIKNLNINIAKNFFRNRLTVKNYKKKLFLEI